MTAESLLAHSVRLAAWRNAALAALLSVSAAAAEAKPGPLFDNVEPLRVTIEGPFGDIARDRTGEPQWQPGQLTHHAANGDSAVFEIRVRARGKNRRKPDVCRFPPLRLDFDSKQVKGTEFAGQNKLKLVTHCESSPKFEQIVLRELLVYRLYNQLTDCSFRVREVHVNYLDTNRKKNPQREFVGFLIEDRDDVAARCDGELARLEKVSRDQFDPVVGNLYALFQYMIGNTDWSMLRGPDGDHCCHNGVLVRREDGGLIPVPYDFDASGFVNAPYAAPSEQLRIDKVTQRLFRGFCRAPGIVDASIARLNAEREAFYATIIQQPGISKKSVAETTRFLDRFYDTINDAKKRQREIDEKCR